MYSSDMVQFKRRYSEIAKGHKQQCLDMKHCAQNVWMVKPVASNQGRGIELYSQLNEVLAHVQYVACCAVEEWRLSLTSACTAGLSPTRSGSCRSTLSGPC